MVISLFESKPSAGERIAVAAGTAAAMAAAGLLVGALWNWVSEAMADDDEALLDAHNNVAKAKLGVARAEAQVGYRQTVVSRNREASAIETAASERAAQEAHQRRLVLLEMKAKAAERAAVIQFEKDLAEAKARYAPKTEPEPAAVA